MRARIKAVGDNLIHKELYRAAALPGGGYCFDSLFAGIRDSLGEADVAVINQETILVKEEGLVSSFPAFGSPVQVGEAAVKAGFTVVTHASNHALDKGIGGIEDSIAFWKGKAPEVCMLGLHASAGDQEKIPVITAGGIRIAMLNYTETLNYRRLPSKAPYCVDVMKKGSKRAIEEKIQKARRMSDFVIVFPHWGCEYLYEPVLSQREWASFFACSGADLIVGTHPHVVQNVEWFTQADGRKTLCIYSMGNFISCQVKAGTMLGAMADIVIEQKDGKTEIVSQKLLPLVTHTDGEYSFFTTYFLSQYSDKLAGENKIFRIVKRNYGIDVDCAYLNRLFEDILAGKAQAYNEFKSPRDVARSNVKGVLNSVMGRNTKI